MDTKLLVLDLDETLIFGTKEPLDRPADLVVGEYSIYDRPFVRDFLSACGQLFKLAVWTSSTEDYASGVVDHLFGSTDCLEFVWARERCTLRFDQSDWVYRYTKNLKKVNKLGFALDEVIVVDNTREKWTRSFGNLILVSDFEGDLEDAELLDLERYLDFLNRFENIRTIEKRGWRSQDYSGQGPVT